MIDWTFLIESESIKIISNHAHSTARLEIFLQALAALMFSILSRDDLKFKS